MSKKKNQNLEDFIGEAIDKDVTLLCDKFDFVNIPKFRVNK